jgi:hypothetical protein
LRARWNWRRNGHRVQSGHGVWAHKEARQIALAAEIGDVRRLASAADCLRNADIPHCPDGGGQGAMEESLRQALKMGAGRAGQRNRARFQ